MSDSLDSSAPRPDDLPPMVIPVRRGPRPELERRPPPPPPPSGGAGKFLLALLLLGSIALNFLLCFGIFAIGGVSLGGAGGDESAYIREKHWSGNKSAKDKVAIVNVEGVLVDELMGSTLAAIDKAAKDDNVKAVVVRINSPGGTITASDDIHKRLIELRDGSSPRFTSAKKPLVASMGAIAASGGYYVAMPAQHIYGEKTTITASIGVYSSMINIHKLASEHGVKMETVKAGDVKNAGSMFHELSPQERQMWQDMVDNAYGQFIKIVEDGRPQLKGKLTKDVERVDAAGNKLPDEIQLYDDKGNVVPGKTVPYHRKLADGGIFTAPVAKHYQLIDDIGYLEDAVKKAATLAGLSDYETVVYEKPVSIMSLLGASAKQSSSSEFLRIAQAAGPRVWYLSPNSEFAGMLALMEKP
jgi:protease-4